MGNYLERQTSSISIANGASVSSAIQLKGMILAGLYMPAAWTSTATQLRFEVSEDGSTFYPAIDASGNYIFITLNTAYPSVPFAHFLSTVGVDFSSANYIRIVTHDGTNPVNQGAARVITAVVRPYLD